MQAISLWQPWATLVACGAKRYETRGWAPPDRLIGERIAIHAAKRSSELWRAGTDPFDMFLPAEPLPLGCIVATAIITEVHRTQDVRVDAIERAFGDYTPGRYAWRLNGLCWLMEPVAFRGRQTFFEVPDDLLAPVAA